MRSVRWLSILMAGTVLTVASGGKGFVRAADEGARGGDETLVPEGMMLIEEDVWYQLADEPNFHFHQARLHFLQRQAVSAAADIKKGTAMIRLAMGLAKGAGNESLRASAEELTALAGDLEHGKAVTLTALNQAFSRAHVALATYNHEAAERHVKREEFKEAGLHLRAAAHDLEHAQAWAGGELSARAAGEVLTAEELAKELVAGAGFALQEVVKSLSALADEVEAMKKLHAVAE